jgi:hypothetical protein
VRDSRRRRARRDGDQTNLATNVEARQVTADAGGHDQQPHPRDTEHVELTGFKKSTQVITLEVGRARLDVELAVGSLRNGHGCRDHPC